jgi:hypothetical protein
MKPKQESSLKFPTPDQVLESLSFQQLNDISVELLAIIHDQEISLLTKQLVFACAGRVQHEMLAHIGGKEFADSFWRQFHAYVN